MGYLKHVSAILILTLAFASLCTAMRITKEVELGPQSGEIPNAEYVARFAVSYGDNIHAAVRVRLAERFDQSLNFPLFFYLVDDSDWETVIHGGDCSNASKKSKFMIEQTLRGDGEWSNWQSVEEQELTDTHVVYIVVSDCAGTTHQSYPNLPKIEVDLHMLNSGSEFSHEESGLIYLYTILLFVYIYFLARTTFTVLKDALNKNDIDAAIMALVFAIYMELLHIATQCIHLYIYSYNGSGFFLLDTASTVLQMNSQIIIVGCFIMIAYGWQITNVDIAKNTKLIVLGVFVCLFQSAMTFLNILDDGAHHKYHDYGGFQGFALVCLRVFLWFIFVYGVMTSIGKISKKAKPLLKALSVAGSLYMMAFPGFWFFCFLVPAHLRNRVIVFGNLGVQLFAIIILLNQLVKRGTQFREASEESKHVFPKAM